MNKISLSLLLMFLVLLCGCRRDPPHAQPISLEANVKVVHAEPRTVKRTVEQPGVIGAYERTALYARVTGFVGKWHVDIGNRVQENEVLVKLSAPELVAQHEQMKAMVVLDKALVDQTNKQHLVSQRNATAADSMVNQARADVKRYVADVKRWESEVERLTTLVAERVVDKQVLDETQRQLSAGQAALEASQAAVKTREAELLSAQATVQRTQTDISAAEARVLVAIAEEQRLKALVDYLTIRAPYNGVVIARNVNVGDFVQPAGGDPTQGAFALGVGPNQATPLYVIQRIDPVLFVVGVPESDAPYVQPHRWWRPGTTAQVRVPRMGYEFTAEVTRISGALESNSRTLQAQIDVPNPDAKFRPGMYAYGSVMLERNNVRAIPASAITKIGTQTYCYLVQNGKAVRTEIQTGLSDASWTEVTGKRINSASGNVLQPFDGTEEVISDNLSDISDGAAVRVEH